MIHTTLRYPAACLFALTFWVFALAPCTPAEQYPTSGKGARLVRESLDETAAFFAEHPELRQPRGSMWKHFVNVRDFLHRRTVNGVLPTATHRVRAWDARQHRLGLSVDQRGWFSIGPPNISGRIVDLDFHPAEPERVYAASAGGGLWLTSDGGDSWRTTTDHLPSLAIGAVCVLPTNPDVVLIATGEGINWRYVVFGVGIWKSADGGETWSPTGLDYEITDNHGFHVMEANPITGTILAGSNHGLWRSTDEGDTWDQVLPDVDYHDVKWKPGSTARVYATRSGGASGNGVIVSNDDGLTWAPCGTGQPPGSRISKCRIAVSDTNPNLIYAHYGDSLTHGTLGIYRSTNNGANWSPRNTTLNISGGQGGYAVTIAVDPDDGNRVIAGGIQLYLSIDGGMSFVKTGSGNPLGGRTTVHVDHHAIAWEPGSTSILWVGTDGGIWRSKDDGDTWHSRCAGLITTQYYDLCLDPADPDFAMGGSQDNGLPWAEETDHDWFASTLLADGCVCAVDPQDPDTIYSEWQFGGHIRSTDRGWSWEPTMNGISGNAVPIAPLALDPNQAGRLFTSTSHGIFRTTNGQQNWVNIDPHPATWISISPWDGGTVWTVNGDTTGPAARVTTDGGSIWKDVSPYGFSVGNETKILAHPTDPATAFVTFAGYSGIAHIARTTDLGASWEDVSGDFPPEPANTMVIDPENQDHWFVGTDSGVWFSPDGGLSWTPFGRRFPNVVVYDLEIQHRARKLVAITYGRGAWEALLPAPNNRRAESGTGHPDLMLDSPLPDRIAGTVSFRFASRAAGRVTLDLFDTRGRPVERVADLSSADGIIRVVQWDIDDIPPGNYFALLRSGSGSLSRRLVVRPGQPGVNPGGGIFR